MHERDDKLQFLCGVNIRCYANAKRLAQSAGMFPLTRDTRYPYASRASAVRLPCTSVAAVHSFPNSVSRMDFAVVG